MRTYPELDRLMQNIEEKGIDVNNEVRGFAFPGTHLSFPGVAIFLCLSGTARIVYDMQEITIDKNNLTVMMPGHFMRAVACSADFTYARTVVSSELLHDIKAHIFSHGSACDYSEEQATAILSEPEVTITADMHQGEAEATAWGCDLTHEYVNINADYRS